MPALPSALEGSCARAAPPAARSARARQLGGAWPLRSWSENMGCPVSMAFQWGFNGMSIF